jgi:hypothetical protein
MIITHLTIIFGMAAMGIANGPSGLFAVFVALKTLVDLAGLWPAKETPLEPPRWLRGLDNLGRSKEGLTFSEHYRQSVEAERAKRAADEVPMERL